MRMSTSTAGSSTHRVTPTPFPRIKLSPVSQGVLNELVELYDFLPPDTPHVFEDLEFIMLSVAVSLNQMERRKLRSEAEARLLFIMIDAVDALWSATARFPNDHTYEPGYLHAVYAKWERKFDQQLLIEIELDRARNAPDNLPHPRRDADDHWYA